MTWHTERDRWEAEEERDIASYQADIFVGDARRCHRHPNVKTSSDDGMYDTAGCERCMAEQDAEEEKGRASC